PLLPFWAEKGHEWREYASLHPRNRVLALKLLCDMRLEREDVKGAIDALLVPPRGTSAAAGAGAGGAKGGAQKAAGGRAGPVAAQPVTRRRRGDASAPPPPPLTVDDVRKRPLGHDSNGAALWVVGRLPDLQLRLYREQAPSWPKPKKPRAPSPPPQEASGRGGKGRGKAAAEGGSAGAKTKKAKGQKALPPYMMYELPPEAVAGRWELLGVGAEGLGGAAEEMRTGSRKQQDRDLADKISTELVSVLVEELDRRERKQQLESRLRAALGTEYLGATRSRRARKEVDYSTAAYDKMLHEALRNTRQTVTVTAAGAAGSRKRSLRSASPAPEEEEEEEQEEEEVEEEGVMEMEEGQGEEEEAGEDAGEEERGGGGGEGGEEGQGMD
ncbi:hypothetical protein Agub_g13068, partial [Astrephomene gubernaculifera]